LPPQTNATLTAVGTSSEQPDDWDVPAAPGDPDAKWAGEVRVYYREKQDRITDGGSVNIFTRRTLFVDTRDLEAIELDTDDLVTFRVDGAGDDATGKAQAITTARLDGIPRELETSRIELDPA
jgi:hypothetical protein